MKMVKTVIYHLLCMSYAALVLAADPAEQKGETENKKQDKRDLLGLSYGYGGSYLQEKYHNYGNPYEHHQPHHEHINTVTTITKEVPVVHKVYVEKPYPVKVHVPVPVDRPYPVPVPKPYPFHIEKHIPYPVEKPVPVPVKVEVPYPIPVPIQKHYPSYAHEKPLPVQVYEKQQPLYHHEEQETGFYGLQEFDLQHYGKGLGAYATEHDFVYHH